MGRSLLAGRRQEQGQGCRKAQLDGREPDVPLRKITGGDEGLARDPGSGGAGSSETRQEAWRHRGGAVSVEGRKRRGHLCSPACPAPSPLPSSTPRLVLRNQLSRTPEGFKRPERPPPTQDKARPWCSPQRRTGRRLSPELPAELLRKFPFSLLSLKLLSSENTTRKLSLEEDLLETEAQVYG